MVVVDEKRVRFAPAPGLQFTVDGKPGSGPVALVADSQGEPTAIGFADGSASMVLIERGGRLALRVRDANAVPRTGFKGISRYPVDIGWRLGARVERHEPGKHHPCPPVPTNPTQT